MKSKKHVKYNKDYWNNDKKNWQNTTKKHNNPFL